MEQIRQLIARIRAQLTELWERMEKKDRQRFLIISGVSLAVIVAAVILLNQKNYVVILSNLELEEAGLYTEQLKALNADYRVQGNSILVPDTVADELRMTLARQNPDMSNQHEIFAQGNTLGSSDYVQKMYEKFDLQAGLERSIETNPGVRDARVYINKPDNSATLFASEKQNTTASVVLTMQSGATLTQEQVGAIETLVAGAVGMDIANVNITNDQFQQLNSRRETDFTTAQAAHELEWLVASQLNRIVLNLLAPFVGEDRIRAESTVHFLWDDVTQQSQTVTPVNDEDGVVISMRSTSEEMTGATPNAGEPGIDENGGDTPEYPEVESATGASYAKSTQEANYEVNRLVENIIKSKGTGVLQLSMSVSIDSTDLATRSPDFTEDIARSLIATAIGIPQSEMQNNITIAIATFAGRADQEAAYQALQDEIRRREIFELIRVLALYAVILTALIILIFRILALFKKKPTPEELAAQEAARRAASGQTEAEEMDTLMNLATGGFRRGAQGEELEEKKSPERERIEEFIEKNPEAVAQLLRTWLADEPEKRRR